MGFKKYIVFSVLFIALVYGYAYSLELGVYRITILDINLSLPVALWLITPLVFLFIATIAHIIFYGLINVFKQRAVTKDHELMITLLKSKLLGKNFNKKFKTSGFKELYQIFSQLNFDVKDVNFTSKDAELNSIVANVQDIKAGKHVNDKSFKLSEASKLANVNLLNKVEEQVDYAVEVLKKTENYSQEVVRAAYLNVLDKKSLTTIVKLYKNIKLDKDLAKKLFAKDAEHSEFGLSAEEITKIVKDLDFTTEDYLFLAKNYESSLKPDQIIALFEKLSSEIDSATAAYLHVLCEYEMIDTVREIVAASKEGEYTAFKALLDLKDAGKHYDLESISYK